jgi:NTE family protein
MHQDKVMQNGKNAATFGGADPHQQQHPDGTMTDAGTAAAAPGGKKGINLALQGGGAHGAFTWGVLDHLLEDGRLTIEGISGASAGAMNAVMVADGLARGGPQEARTRLADFWRAASIDGDLPEIQRKLVERLFTFMPVEGSPVAAWLEAMSHYFSPYDLNPLNLNPLKGLIERFVDFEAVRAYSPLQLFVSATNVTTGRLRVFPREKITADAVMASACLPLLFKAVVIDGVPYWDGGYLSNPPIFPLFHATRTEDVLVVQINPLERKEVPTSSRDIVNRVNEISFSSSLAAEFRAVEFVARLIDRGQLQRGTGPGQYRRINAHRIALGENHKAYSADTKLSTDYEFFRMLHAGGRRAARRFLDEHFDDIGRRSTFDLRAEARAEWA